MGTANSVQAFFIYNITQDRNIFRFIILKTEKLNNGTGHKICVTFFSKTHNRNIFSFR